MDGETTDRTTPRVAPGTPKQIGLVNNAICWVGGKVIRGERPNILATLARQRRLFRVWLLYSGALMPFGKFPRRETELMILRIAHLRESAYEFSYHYRIGRRVGLSEDEIERVRLGPDAPGWSERERVLLRAITQLNQTRDLDDELWAELRTHLSAAECIELVQLSGQYESVATTIQALRIQLD